MMMPILKNFFSCFLILLNYLYKYHFNQSLNFQNQMIVERKSSFLTQNFIYLLMRINLLGAKNLLNNQKQYQSSGQFQQKQNQQTLINSKVKSFSTSKMPKEGYHFRYINPTEIKEINKGHPLSVPKRVITRGKSEASRFAQPVTNEQIIKGESSIKYIPYERKIVQYEDRSFVQKVPIKRKVIKYEEKRVMETVPRERIEQNYYAVQTKVQYLKEIVPQKKIEMVPVQRKIKRYDYVPVERQIVHYPSNDDVVKITREQSRTIVEYQPVQPSNQDEFVSINSNQIYTYTTRRRMRDYHVGHGDQKQSILISRSIVGPSPKIEQKQLNNFKNDDNQASFVSPQKGSRQNKGQLTANYLFVQGKLQSQLNVNNLSEKASFEVLQKFSDEEQKLEPKQDSDAITTEKTYLMSQRQVGDSIIIKRGDVK